MGRIAGRASVAFFTAAITAYVIALFGGLLLGDMLGVSQQEGAFAMGLAFTIAPVIAAVSGGAAAVFTVRRAVRRTEEVFRGRSPLKTVILRTAIGGALGFCLGFVVQWLWLEGQSFSGFGQALLASMLPEIALVAGAAIGLSSRS